MFLQRASSNRGWVFEALARCGRGVHDSLSDVRSELWAGLKYGRRVLVLADGVHPTRAVPFAGTNVGFVLKCSDFFKFNCLDLC